MPRRTDEAEPPVAALARTALAQGSAAMAANKLDVAVRWLDRAHSLVPQDANVILALATACLRDDPERAAELFGALVTKHDVRQAWLGLAAAYLRMGRLTEAREPLSSALARHAFVPDIVAVADQIAGSFGGGGWCSVTSSGDLIIRPRGDRTEIRLDGEPVAGTALPRGWSGGRRVDVLVGGRPALGSPILIRAVRRTMGFVEAWEGGIRGWAWHPGDPDTPAELTLLDPASGRTQTIRAISEDVAIPDIGPLARPRAFRVTKDELSDSAGPIHVRGPHGDDLLGSPLDPAAAWSVRRRAAPAAGKNRAALPREAVGADGCRRGVSVVIPVRDCAEIAMACLRSVLATVSRDTDVVVVDDGSSDPVMVATLDDLAEQRKIVLLRHPKALGFPASANAGIIAASDRDVALLNSDALVPRGWLDRLRAAAHSAADIGSVTPFSNNAGVLSYPGGGGINQRPDQAATDRLDRLARRANGADVVDIPVGAGFCVYLRRDCLSAVGLSRADIFAQGPGGQNDFCLRGGQLGWRHVALTGLFVGHQGDTRFEADANQLRARNAVILERLHPGHDRLIEAFVAQDPLAAARRRIDLARWAAGGHRWAGAVVLITHNEGGGVESRVAEAARSHAAAGRRPIVLRPSEGTDGELAIVVSEGVAADFPNLVYRMPRQLADLRRLLRAAKPGSIEVHHFLGHPQQAVHELVTTLGTPYDVHIHDYAWFCPRVSLVGAGDRYCGEPDLAGCEACVADLGHFLHEEITVSELRARSAGLLAGARRIITPSDDAGRRIRRHFGDVSPVTVPHEDDAAIRPSAEVRGVGLTGAAGSRLRVCVVGAIGVHKGYDVLLACARDASTRGLELEFVVVGTTIDDGRLLSTGHAFVTGGFRSANSVGLIVAQRASVGFVPSIWPETWCLCLGDIWRAGLEAAAFDIGAPAERIRRAGRGFLLPLGLSACAINNTLMETNKTLYRF